MGLRQYPLIYRQIQNGVYDNVHAAVVTADMPPEQLASAEGSDALCLATLGAGHIPP